MIGVDGVCQQSRLMLGIENPEIIRDSGEESEEWTRFQFT
jgi:hypothetical protein